MTTEEKKAALEAADVKVRANASDKTIDRLYEEHLAASTELDAKADELRKERDSALQSEFDKGTAKTLEIVRTLAEKGVVSVEVTSDEKPAVLTSVRNGMIGNGAFNAFLEANQDKMMGDKTPAVVAWARENLTKEEFEARYGGRTLPI